MKFLNMLKLVNIVPALLLVSIFSCSYHTNHDNMKSEMKSTIENKEKFFDVVELQSIIERSCKDINQNINRSILVIGDTGTGKSTLVNALLGIKLKAKEYEFGIDQYSIRPVTGEKGPEIGDTSISVTTIPQLWVKGENAFWDCPGFEDTKGPIQDIANAFYINRIFENSKEVKILLVISHSQLCGDRTSTKIVKKFSNIFKDIIPVMQSLSVVITKVNPRYKVDKYRGLFRAIQEEQSESCTDKEKIFYEFLAKKRRLGLMYLPKEDGVYAIDETISNIVCDSKYIKSPEINIPISYSSINFVYSLSDNCKKRAYNFYEKLQNAFYETKKSIDVDSEKLDKKVSNQTKNSYSEQSNRFGSSYFGDIAIGFEYEKGRKYDWYHSSNQSNLKGELYLKKNEMPVKKEVRYNKSLIDDESICFVFDYNQSITKLYQLKKFVDSGDLKGFNDFIQKICKKLSIPCEMPSIVEIGRFCEKVLNRDEKDVFKISDVTHISFDDLLKNSSNDATKIIDHLRKKFNKYLNENIDSLYLFVEKYKGDELKLKSLLQGLQKITAANSVEQYTISISKINSFEKSESLFEKFSDMCTVDLEELKKHYNLSTKSLLEILTDFDKLK
jgi:predicted GTPase